MESILEELYFGNISPMDDGHPKSAEYRQKSRQYAQQNLVFLDALKELDEALYHTFDELSMQKSHLNLCEEIAAFQKGFCLGTALMQEVSQRLSNWT